MDSGHGGGSAAGRRKHSMQGSEDEATESKAQKNGRTQFLLHSIISRHHSLPTHCLLSPPPHSLPFPAITSPWHLVVHLIQMQFRPRPTRPPAPPAPPPPTRALPPHPPRPRHRGRWERGAAAGAGSEVAAVSTRGLGTSIGLISNCRGRLGRAASGRSSWPSGECAGGGGV
jgi:hypothetical protein